MYIHNSHDQLWGHLHDFIFTYINPLMGIIPVGYSPWLSVGFVTSKTAFCNVLNKSSGSIDAPTLYLHLTFELSISLTHADSTSHCKYVPALHIVQLN